MESGTVGFCTERILAGTLPPPRRLAFQRAYTIQPRLDPPSAHTLRRSRSIASFVRLFKRESGHVFDKRDVTLAPATWHPEPRRRALGELERVKDLLRCTSGRRVGVAIRSALSVTTLQ